MYGREYQQKLNTLTDNSFKEKIDNMIRYITNFIDEKTKDFDEYTDSLQSLELKQIFHYYVDIFYLRQLSILIMNY